MSNEDFLQTFIRAADAWVCDSYTLDIRYLASVEDNNISIWDASVLLSPNPVERDLSFKFDSETFIVGQIQRPGVRKSELMKLLKKAANGEIEIAGRKAKLAVDVALDYYSEMSHRERWFAELHLQVIGAPKPQPPNIELAAIDNALRASDLPFDGLTDAAAWLGLRSPGSAPTAPSIALRVLPPVDLIFEKCLLKEDRFTLTLQCHPKFEVGRLRIAVRAVPGGALDGRKQIAELITWSRVRESKRVGVAQIELKQADNVLAMLMIENNTVRRQWFIDPAKARNNRLLAIQYFDNELRMVKQAVFESTESAKFEHGVAALLFLMGFTPSVQLENNAPDLIVTTPGGKLAIVECTIRISDFATKVGKLVDRRGALAKQLSANGHPAEVVAVLICRLPRDQIAAQAAEPRAHNIILLSGNELQAGFDAVRNPSDPDKLIENALVRLAHGQLQN